MLIRDLPRPVTASKADWLPGTTWLGFTPQGRGPGAAAQCESTVQGQFGNGYVLERITQSFGDPNLGFENDPLVMRDRVAHEALKDRLVAVHRLRHSMRSLVEIIGTEEYEHLQNVWSGDAARRRWSVAFPIVESYEIVGKPRAKDVFPPEVFRRLYQTQSATLRPLDDEARAAIAGLTINQSNAPNAWIAIEDECTAAELLELPPEIERRIAQDLVGAIEGETDERRLRITKRAVWMANKFVIYRRRGGKLFCDECGFDPRHRIELRGIAARSCFDVHHKHPLAEGVRRTTLEDFALLCPTCHRLAHLLLRATMRN